MAGPNTRAKTTVDTAVYQAVQDYLESNTFLKAVEIAIERGIDKQLSKLIGRLERLEEKTSTTMDQIEKNAGLLMDLEVDLHTKAKEIERLNKVISSQSSSMSNLQLELNDMQQYSRRNCLKFYGIPENKGEDTDKVVCDIASERLEVKLSPEDLDRSHRVAARASHNGTVSATDVEGGNNRKKKPRAIIVKFCSYRKRSEVLRARRKLKGSKIAIDEALTAFNQDLLWKAKRHDKVKEAWSSDGHVTVLIAGTNGKDVKKVIRKVDELTHLK